MSKVVIWSGGLDSTLLLTSELARARKGQWIKALTLIHPQLPQDQLKCERAARREFKKWARKKLGVRFTHDEVRVSTKAAVSGDVGQPGLWLCHLMPYLWPGDDVLFGYVRGDDYWHFRHLFVQAFDALAAAHQMTGRLRMEWPFEWLDKPDVIRGAQNYRLPRRCWWTCDSPRMPKEPWKKPRACGRCNKCREYRHAKADLKRYGSTISRANWIPRPPTAKERDAMEDETFAVMKGGEEEMAADG